MRALAQAAVDAVEGTLDRNMLVLRMDVAICAAILREAQTGSVEAPAIATAITWAGLEGAVHTTIARLAPALAINALAVGVCAVPQALLGGAVILSIPAWGTAVWHTVAGAIVAVAKPRALIRTEFEVTCKAGPTLVALTDGVVARATRLAVVGARGDRARGTNEARAAETGAIVAVPIVRAIIWASLQGAVIASVAWVAHTGIVLAGAMARAFVGASFLLTGSTSETRAAVAGAVVAVSLTIAV